VADTGPFNQELQSFGVKYILEEYVR